MAKAVTAATSLVSLLAAANYNSFAFAQFFLVVALDSLSALYPRWLRRLAATAAARLF
jgi:hypothetical protein